MTALAANKTTSQVAVAGRSIFKIYSINNSSFELISNLRVVKNVIAGCNDIAWNQVDDNILASATTSGAIVTWNLNKSGFSKMDLVYHDHKRIVNKIRFHTNDPWLLISGSQDSIKVFDLRQSEAVINYSDLSESVRDLQFSPSKPNSFVAVQDNGYVQLYDIRKKDKFEQSFPAHNGPILACDWHHEQVDLLATAGRDMSIKIWNLSGQTPYMQHCIPTMEAVSKVKWSYDNRSYMASCSLKRDFSINVWDIHRPFIASAKFTELHDITTGMLWLKDVNQSCLISVTSTGNLYKLPLGSAYRPLEHANPVGMAINPDGDIALAIGNGLLRGGNSLSFQSFGNNNGSTNYQSTIYVDSVSNQASTSSSSNANNNLLSSATPQQSSLPSKFPYQTVQSRGGGRHSVTRRSQDSALKPRISSRSQLDVYKCTEMNWFVKTAQEYQLSNRSLAELCDHNAEVCAKLRRFQICQTWKILKLFYANINATTSTTTNTVATNTNASTTVAVPPATSSNQQISSNNNRTIGSTPGGDNLSISSHVAEESELNFRHQMVAVADLNAIMNNQPTSNVSALDEDDRSLVGSEQSNDSTDEWVSHETISYEAFQHKHDFCGRVEKLIDHKINDDSVTDSASSDHDEELMNTNVNNNSRSNDVQINSSSNPHGALTNPVFSNDMKISNIFNTKAYQFKFYEIIADVIADVLKYHVDNSDVQSAVSILIVLGDRIKNIVNERIPEMDRESWYYSYIDLLSKFQLWNVMAQVINLSPLQNINSINQTSTTIYTTCGSCNRPLNGKVSWICDRCKTKPSQCSVCHGVVAGLMAWCQGCYHGGHLIHMNQWFSENDYCPTGCGHLCELSQWR